MTDTADLLTEAARRLPAARKALDAATGDIPPAGGSGGGSGTSDRTGRLALAVIDGTDTAVLDSRRLDALERVCIARCKAGQDIAAQLRQVLDICDRWAPDPRRKAALDANLRAAADDMLNRHDDQGNCTSCKRVPGAWGEPHRRGLCKTCSRHLDRVHALYDVVLELPPKRLVEVLQSKGKVTDQDIHVVMHGSVRRV